MWDDNPKYDSVHNSDYDFLLVEKNVNVKYC